VSTSLEFTSPDDENASKIVSIGPVLAEILQEDRKTGEASEGAAFDSYRAGCSEGESVVNGALDTSESDVYIPVRIVSIRGVLVEESRFPGGGPLTKLATCGSLRGGNEAAVGLASASLIGRVLTRHPSRFILDHAR